MLKNATITLKFNKTGQDTIQWKGKITIAAGISLNGLPVTVDVGGVTQSFVLNKSGIGEQRRRQQVRPERRASRTA